jgi:hypothetical protein
MFGDPVLRSVIGREFVGLKMVADVFVGDHRRW